MENKDPKQKVIGSALYFELERRTHDPKYSTTPQVAQILLLPQFILDNTHSKIKTMERRLTPFRKRAHWRIYTTFPVSNIPIATEQYVQHYKDIVGKDTFENLYFNKVSKDKAEEIAETLLGGFVKRDLNLSINDSFYWALVNKPFAVDVTEFDARQITQAKAPQAVQKRIERSRVALGYPSLSRVYD